MKGFATFTFGCVALGLSNANAASVRGASRNLQGLDWVVVSGCETLYAAQTIDVGALCATIEGTDLAITYSATAPWYMEETHLWAGTGLSTMPQTRKGSPKIGNFPHGTSTSGETWSKTLSLESLGLSPTCTAGDTANILIAAHAVATNAGTGDSETAWANGDRFVSKGMWGTFSTVQLNCPEPEVEATDDGPASGTCETAFAKESGGGICFLDIDEDGDTVGDFNRWGWTNGPIPDGFSGSYNVYAGAGQCSLTKGTFVGTMSVTYSEGTATVVYSMAAGFTLSEAQTYFGNEILARDSTGSLTVAPGQYPLVNEFEATTIYTHTMSGLIGDIYVVAHSVACGEF